MEHGAEQSGCGDSGCPQIVSGECVGLGVQERVKEDWEVW